MGVLALRRMAAMIRSCGWQKHPWVDDLLSWKGSNLKVTASSKAMTMIGIDLHTRLVTALWMKIHRIMSRTCYQWHGLKISVSLPFFLLSIIFLFKYIYTIQLHCSPMVPCTFRHHGQQSRPKFNKAWNLKYKQYTPRIVQKVRALLHALFSFDVQFYPHPFGLFHWYWGNYTEHNTYVNKKRESWLSKVWLYNPCGPFY